MHGAPQFKSVSQEETSNRYQYYTSTHTKASELIIITNVTNVQDTTLTHVIQLFTYISTHFTYILIHTTCTAIGLQLCRYHITERLFFCSSLMSFFLYLLGIFVPPLFPLCHNMTSVSLLLSHWLHACISPPLLSHAPFPDVQLVQWGELGIQRLITQLPVSPFGAMDHVYVDSWSLHLSRLHTLPSPACHHRSSSTCFPAPSQASLGGPRPCVPYLGPSLSDQRANRRVFFNWEKSGGIRQGKK